ncbi:MAG: hypothetical protein M3N17_01310 [Actinomycetota bacterium]|nr:hypothetical protein [Actinomycetota bacterium]
MRPVEVAQWLRRNSERSLMDAAEEDLARRYLGRGGPVGRQGPATLFWRRVFVPAYRALPWGVRHAALRAMPGSHRRRWR